MVVLISLLMALLTLVAILYPFLRRSGARLDLEDEGSPQAELDYLWEGVVAGLRDAEMEQAIGNLAEGEYRRLRQQYMAEAAALLRAAELGEQQEEAFLKSIEEELREVRQRILGGPGDGKEGDVSPQGGAGEASDG